MTGAADSPGGGTSALAANIAHFGRLLRAAGLPIGTGKAVDAVRAVEAAGVTRRDDVYWALHAVFVNRRDQHALFDRAFELFWRGAAPTADLRLAPDDRAAESPPLVGDVAAPADGEAADEANAGHAVLTYSPREALRTRDFEAMSDDELAAAKRVIARMRPLLARIATRRYRPGDHGSRIDVRASLRAALRSGANTIPLRLKTPRLKAPPLVVLCDISGSMSRYTRTFLHFLHALGRGQDRVHVFVFGTRLTNVTRLMRGRDADAAVARVGAAVEDWDGGTRIGQCLRDFNRRWSRRVLGQGAVVLLISDGLDRDAAVGLEAEVERLHKSCRRLIWLNPLLRYRGFEPISLGIRAILPHVDEFRPVHDLASLENLVAVLGRLGARKEEGTTQWRQAS